MRWNPRCLTPKHLAAYGLALTGRLFARARGGASVLVNGAVFKTVSETARAGSGRFDSYTPPPIVSEKFGLRISKSTIKMSVLTVRMRNKL